MVSKSLTGLFRFRKKSAGTSSDKNALPTDPFGERVDMDIAFRNELHELLYTRIRKGNVPATEFIWDVFLGRYPEFENLREQWLLSRRKGVTPMNHGLPWMNYAAINFLETFLTPESKVFEWGMGGSTVYWSARAGEVVSVEHDAKWFALAKKALACPNATGTMPTLKLFDPEAKPAQKYGSGLEKYRDLSFENYIRSIQEFPAGHFDLIVVDGRARMPCLHNCAEQLAPNGVILLDNSDYTRYQPELDRFWKANWQRYDRTDFLSPTPFSSNIGSQTSIFVGKPA